MKSRLETLIATVAPALLLWTLGTASLNAALLPATESASVWNSQWRNHGWGGNQPDAFQKLEIGGGGDFKFRSWLQVDLQSFKNLDETSPFTFADLNLRVDRADYTSPTLGGSITIYGLLPSSTNPYYNWTNNPQGSYQDLPYAWGTTPAPSAGSDLVSLGTITIPTQDNAPAQGTIFSGANGQISWTGTELVDWLNQVVDTTRGDGSSFATFIFGEPSSDIAKLRFYGSYDANESFRPTLDYVAIPEPSTLMLFGIALVSGLVALRRRG